MSGGALVSLNASLVDAAPWPPLVLYGTSVPGSDDHTQ